MLKQVGDSMIWEVLGNSRCCEEAGFVVGSIFLYSEARPDCFICSEWENAISV